MMNAPRVGPQPTVRSPVDQVDRDAHTISAVYRADDASCSGKAYPAGTVIIEGTVPHIIRNEGSVQSEFSVVFMVPAGAAQRIDAPAPGTCPF